MGYPCRPPASCDAPVFYCILSDLSIEVDRRDKVWYNISVTWAVGIRGFSLADTNTHKLTQIFVAKSPTLLTPYETAQVRRPTNGVGLFALKG